MTNSLSLECTNAGVDVDLKAIKGHLDTLNPNVNNPVIITQDNETETKNENICNKIQEDSKIQNTENIFLKSNIDKKYQDNVQVNASMINLKRIENKDVEKSLEKDKVEKNNDNSSSNDNKIINAKKYQQQKLKKILRTQILQ